MFSSILTLILLSSVASAHSLEGLVSGDQQVVPQNVQPFVQPIQESPVQVVPNPFQAEPVPVPVHLVDQVQPVSFSEHQKNFYSAVPDSVKPVDKQYGQPESASIPPGYKQFGSWGLYIGGSPNDGYYTNFYKSLDNVVGNQQASPQYVSPLYKQAIVGSQVGHQYPHIYAPSELVSGAPIHTVSSYSSSPVEGVSGLPEHYAVKRVGSPVQQAREISKVSSSSSSSSSNHGVKGGVKGVQQVELPQQPVKGYSYSPLAVPLSSPVFVGQQQVQQKNQVVAYSVPVGSQIVGSQPGADGAFLPYGVHGLTRYAVKPTLVSGDSVQSVYYQGVPSAVDSPLNLVEIPRYQKQYQVVAVPTNYHTYGYDQFQAAPLSHVAGPVTQVVGVQASQAPVVHHVQQAPVQQVAASPVSPLVETFQAAPVAPVAAPAPAPVVVAAPVEPLAAPQSPVQVAQAKGQFQVQASPISQQQEVAPQQEQQVSEKQVEKGSTKQ